MPVEPIAAIVDAFRTHEIVAISDPDGNVQLQAFLLSLVRDARFPAAVNDIVSELLSARYQDAIDRFIATAARSSSTPRATCSGGRSPATTTCPHGRRRPS
ncbi:MAG: hypothetical protein DMF87_20175 [Acidobacteria bacterium]|nr:MAG: hypothetical protein DMF88_24635 [Acidobacteriota bacterium]PYR75572.1 MAG: hypothetical protein DMF87_20175 [Acidobacteriota bacterium]